MAKEYNKAKGYCIAHGTYEELADLVIREGELIHCDTDNRTYIGDGENTIDNLPYILTSKDYKVYKFETDDWATISSLAESGDAEKYYSIGDEKTVSWNGESVKIRIVGFNHFDKVGGGKAGIVCQTVNCLPNVYYEMGESSSESEYGYATSPFNEDTSYVILDGFETALKNVIKEVYFNCDNGWQGYSDEGGEVIETSAKLFLPTLAEIYSQSGLTSNCSLTDSWWQNTRNLHCSMGSQLEYYKEKIGNADGYSANKEVVKYNGDNSTEAVVQMTRDMQLIQICTLIVIDYDGGFCYYQSDIDAAYSIAPLFCI